MNLYSVKVAVNIVVYAADEQAAINTALNHERDERCHAVAESAEKIISPEALPSGWDAGCLPWGRSDDACIGDIIGFPAKVTHADD